MFSDQVANGADQVSNGAQILSQGVIAQASSVEELAATMSEISQQVKENAETSQVVKTAAGEMGANILACNCLLYTSGTFQRHRLQQHKNRKYECN